MPNMTSFEKLWQARWRGGVRGRDVLSLAMLQAIRSETLRDWRRRGPIGVTFRSSKNSVT